MGFVLVIVGAAFVWLYFRETGRNHEHRDGEV